MTIKAHKIFILLFLLIVFSQLYVPSFRINMLIQLFAILVILLLDDTVLTKGIVNKITPLLLIFGLGMFTSIFHEFKLIHFVKDITHFLKPILGLMLGYFIFKKLEFNVFVKVVILAGFASALLHFCLIFIFGNLSSESINDIRNSFGKDNFLELFSLLFALFYGKFQQEPLFKSKVLRNIILVVLVISNTLYFSRTMVIVFAVALLSIYGFTKINAKTIRFFLVSIALIAVFYAYLFSIKLDRNAAGVESFLYKVKIAPSEVFSTKINRENHKDLWDHWRGYEVKRAFALMNESKSSYVIGTGFGSLIDLKFKAPLDLKGIRYISETHNGYMYIFYKTGILGLLLLLYFLKKLHSYVYREYTFVNQFVGLTGMVFFFTTLTITGIYNPKDVIIIILGGLIAVSHNNNATRSTLK